MHCLDYISPNGLPEFPNTLQKNGAVQRNKTMEKIMIIGSPGAGKSTFARRLKEATGLPLYYLDAIWHRSDQTTLSKEEFDAKLEEIVRKERWIIDGNYQRTLGLRLEWCDTVFLLDYPLEVCLLGASSRIGVRHEDLPWMETEFDEEFKQSIMDFPKTQLPQIYELLQKYQADREIFVFKSREEAERFLKDNQC